MHHHSTDVKIEEAQCAAQSYYRSQLDPASAPLSYAEEDTLWLLVTGHMSPLCRRGLAGGHIVVLSPLGLCRSSEGWSSMQVGSGKHDFTVQTAKAVSTTPLLFQCYYLKVVNKVDTTNRCEALKEVYVFKMFNIKTFLYQTPPYQRAQIFQIF